MEPLNFVELIENNPITVLSKDYNVKLLSKIKDNFNEFEQQLFLSSFYCYLKYHPVNDFVINLDDVWKWLGFSQKINSKKVLTKHFLPNIDYKILLCNLEEQKNGSGGHNKETILLNIKTFKLFCIKAGTKKANEIHEYFIKLEQLIQDTVQEETNELKIQLQQKDKLLEQSQNNSYLLREKTLLQQFPNNTQCIYYGVIDNLGPNGEKLVKFGNSNFLNDRVDKHKKTYSNFYLINAFKVHNKLQIENAIKLHPILSIKRRNLIIENINHNELLDIDNLSFQELDKIIKDIIFSVEYSVENYNKLFKEYEILKFKNILNEGGFILINAVNEILVQKFLQNEITFTDITNKLLRILNANNVKNYLKNHRIQHINDVFKVYNFSRSIVN